MNGAFVNVVGENDGVDVGLVGLGDGASEGCCVGCLDGLLVISLALQPLIPP